MATSDPLIFHSKEQFTFHLCPGKPGTNGRPMNNTQEKKTTKRRQVPDTPRKEQLLKKNNNKDTRTDCAQLRTKCSASITRRAAAGEARSLSSHVTWLPALSVYAFVFPFWVTTLPLRERRPRTAVNVRTKKKKKRN